MVRSTDCVSSSRERTGDRPVDPTTAVATTAFEAITETCGWIGQPWSTQHRTPADEKNTTADRSSAWMQGSSLRPELLRS